MNFKVLVPNIFYSDVKTGLQLFVDCLGFTVTYEHTAPGDQPFVVIEKGDIKAHLVQSPEFAAKDRPEFRLETDNILALYDRVRDGFSNLLHPNLNTVTLRPWNAKEFALADASGVCVIVQEWMN